MKTYVNITISSEGAKVSNVVQKMRDLGFEAQLGTHDFVYQWKGKDVTPLEVIDFIDRIQTSLRGDHVLLHFTTIR